MFIPTQLLLHKMHVLPLVVYINSMQAGRSWFQFQNPAFKIRVLDYTYTSQPSINTALPLTKSTIKTVIFYIGVVLSLGFVWLLGKWSPKRRAMFTCNVSPPKQADYFLIHDQEIQHSRTIVQKKDKYQIRMKRNCVSFTYHDRQYIYIQEKEVFVPIRYQQLGKHLDKLKKDKFFPPSETQRTQLLAYYGQNVMSLPVQNQIQIFIQQMLTPYEVFQMYGIILWLTQQYYVFSVILLAYSLYTYWNNATDIKKNQQKLAFQSYFDVQTKILVDEQRRSDVQLCTHKYTSDEHKSEIMKNDFNGVQQHDIDSQMSSDRNRPQKRKSKSTTQQAQMTVVKPKTVKRGQKQVGNQENNLINNRNIYFKSISSIKLVPGDIIILNQLDIVPCDCILLRGEALVNEKYSTGDNFLVRKEQIQNFTYHKQNQKSFMLYLGTQIVKIKNIQYRTKKAGEQNQLQAFEQSMAAQKIDYVNQLVCLVTETSYNTLRGKYLRAIRYQPRQEQSFFTQTIYFIYILIIITTIVYAVYLALLNHYTSTTHMFIVYLDLLATAIPPTLPTVLTFGIDFVTRRLKAYNINCVLPRSALTAGKVNTVVLKGDDVFGKDFQIHSASVGIKNQRGMGLTFSSVSQFETYNDRFTINQSDLQQRMRKIKQKQSFYELGTAFFNALTCCHTLQFFRNQIEGSIYQKKIFAFSQGSNVGQDKFQTLNHQISVLKIIRFKQKHMKMGALVSINKKKNVLQSANQRKRQQEDREIDQNEVTIKHSKKLMEQPELPVVQSQSSQSEKKYIFVKGSAQKILNNCDPQTYPHNAYNYIVDMAEKGFRLYGYAMKQFTFNPRQNFDFQDYVNHVPFTFLGFIIMQPVRQDDNVDAIKELNDAQVKLIYLSSQRELQSTSKAVANGICNKNQLLLCNISKNRDKITCKGHIQWQSSAQQIVPEFLAQFQQFGRTSKVSMSSALYDQLFFKADLPLSQQLFNKTCIFNKMQLKYQKNLYLQLQKRKRITCAVGRSGSVSQSAALSLELQRQQGAMLSSFHTKSSSLKSIVDCLRICRAGLSTNFQGFSMMILFTLVQFSTVVILNLHYEALTSSQSLYQDLFITFPIFITIYLTKPAQKLSKEIPPTSFFSLRHIVSMTGQLVIQFIAQLAFILYVLSIDYFQGFRQQAKHYYVANGDFRVGSQLSLAIFVLSNNLYLGIVLSTSVARPFRKPFYTNPYYTINLLLLWLYNTSIVIYPDLSPQQMRPRNLSTETEFILVLALVVGNLVMVLMYLFENLLVFLWSKENPCLKKGQNGYQIDQIRE